MTFKNKIKQKWFDLTHPSEWVWLYKIRRTIWKIKDYDRMENDYIEVVCHATCSMMSKSCYDVDTIKSVIDEQQQRFYEGIIKDDINDTIKMISTEENFTHEDAIEDIKRYIDDL